MESTPVSGVEMRNEVVAPRLAPFCRIAAAVGSTEQEQSGRGIPQIDAVKTDFQLRLPNNATIFSEGTNVWIRPSGDKAEQNIRPRRFHHKPCFIDDIQKPVVHRLFPIVKLSLNIMNHILPPSLGGVRGGLLEWLNPTVV